MTVPNRAQMLVGIQFVILGFLALAIVLLPAQSGTGARVLGVLLALSSAGVFVSAFMAHNRTNAAMPNVSPVPKQNVELVTHGIYAHIRHPIYTGVLLVTLGVACWHGHGVAFALFAALVVLFWVKSRYEETLLRAQFPDYAAYMQRTGRFLPVRF